MSQINAFPQEIHDDIGYYIYRLIDPRSAETFYIGKGKGNRVFQHAKGIIEQDDSDESQLSNKMKTIRDIKNAGFEVDFIIHRHGMDEDTAFEVEAALMDAYPYRTNIMSGHGSSEKGIMNVKQIIRKYKAEIADLSRHNLLMISINKSITNESKEIFDAVRYAWVIDKNKAKNADYILAIKQGMIVGVFVADEWLDATQDNFPGFSEEFPKRKGFVGREADKKIKEFYLDKVIPEEYRKKGAANPIKYNY